MLKYSLHCVLVPANSKPVPFVVAFFEVLYDIGAGDRAKFSEVFSQILLFDQWPEPADEDFEVFSVHFPGIIHLELFIESRSHLSKRMLFFEELLEF